MQSSISAQELWLKVLETIEPIIKKSHFLTWFQNTAVVDFSDGNLKIGVPNMYAKGWLDTHFNDNVLLAIQNLNVNSVEFEVDSSLNMPDNIRAIDLNKLFVQKKPRKLPNKQEVMLVEGVSSKCLNPRYNINNFIVGPSNRLAHAACSAVANSPGKLYNPLFIYGGVGLGRTHLLQATGNAILRNDQSKVVVYVTSERFTNEIVEAIGRRNSQSFKDRYRKVDCLIIDDIQFLANKDRTQEEFFHTFNELYDNSKQIIISSDKAPKDLSALEQRLVSRFEMGMIVDVQFPDYETRLAILHSKCQEHQVLIHHEVLEYMAMNVHHSVRELEGVLVQAIAEAQLEHSTPTVNSVARIIKKLSRNSAQDYETSAPTVKIVANAQDIMQIVASHYKVSVNDLTGDSRKRQFLLPRQMAMHIIRNELNFAYEQIGELFLGKNHTTVMHSCEKIAAQLKKDRILLHDFNSIKKEMGL